jgi:hypothetical protein
VFWLVFVPINHGSEELVMRKSFKYFLLALMTAFMSQAVLAGTEFSAMTRISTAQQKDVTARIFVSESAIRSEYELNGNKLVQITDFKAGLVSLVNPALRSYKQRPVTMADAAMAGKQLQLGDDGPCAGLPGLVCTSHGSEKINDRMAVKWSMSPRGSEGGRDREMIVWLDSQRGMPLKQVLPDGATMTRRLLGTDTVSQRQAEKWEITVRTANGESSVSYQWYDEGLGITLREEQPGGYLRDVYDIKPGPQSASLFTVPDAYSKVEVGQQKTPLR